MSASLLCFFVVAAAAGPAGAVLPDWSPNISPEAIHEAQETLPAPPAEDTERLLAPAAAEPVYKEVFASVDQARLLSLIKDMSGVNPVTVGGGTFTISNRYSPEAKARYRKYWG